MARSKLCWNALKLSAFSLVDGVTTTSFEVGFDGDCIQDDVPEGLGDEGELSCSLRF